MKLFEEIYTGYRGMSGGSDDGKNFWEPGEFDKITSKKSVGKWYTSDPEVAEWYGDGKVIKNELEFDDPMIIDAEGADYHDIQINGKRYNSDKLSLMAYENDHDGLVIENVKDPKVVADTYVALKPNTIKESQLFEQIYRTGKSYYHISPNKFTKFEKRNRFRGTDVSYGGTFLTPKLVMINDYLRDYLMDKFRQDEYYLYRCLLTKPLNLFNPGSRKDRTAFLTEVRKNPREFFFNFAMKQPGAVYRTLQSELTEVFRTHKWSQMENPMITDIVRKLNYDGYVSEENGVGNIFVFNPENIQIIRYDNKRETIYRPVRPFDPNEPLWDISESEDIDTFKQHPINNTRPHSFDRHEFDDLDIDKEDFMIRQGDMFELDVTSITNKDGKMNLNLMYDYLEQGDIKRPFEFQGMMFKNSGELEKYLIDTFGISDIEESID